MLIKAILYISLTLTLLTPLISVISLGINIFLNRPPAQAEKTTFRLVRFFYLFSLGCSLMAWVSYVLSDHTSGTIDFAHLLLAPDFAVDMRLFFDSFSLVFLVTCTLITAVIIFFSHRYLHRDPGYGRFFIIISLFAFGINLMILAGTFDLIFAAWEIMGLSSFLLIGYFWHRPKAIAAACRAYYIYRIFDLGLLTSLLITHFLWHDISIFADFLDTNTSSILSHVSIPIRWLLSLCILLPVLGKSAQFPLCFWLPKAMEGPTHSSAIFYGSLSIHAGVFLLIRTMPVWYFTPGFNYLLGTIGLITAVCATLFALVQSNIKGQIGYASIAQVGLMLIELSLGLTNLAFIHMIGNAFLRCFQLLVSSSILTTHLHMQNVVRTFGQLHKFSLPNLFPKRLQPSIYIFAINDGFFENILNKLFVKPFMLLSCACNNFLYRKIPAFINRFITNTRQVNESTFRAYSPLLPLFILLIVIDLVFKSNEIIRLFSLGISLFFALASLGEQKSAKRALLLAILGNIFAFLSITTGKAGLLYLIGLFASSLTAMEALRYMNSRRTLSNFINYQGLYQQFPRASFILLIGILGIICFPFSSTFYGEDILLNISVHSGLHYLIIFQLIFIIIGISLMRFYALLIFGRRDNCMTDINLDYSASSTILRLLFFILGNSTAFFVILS